MTEQGEGDRNEKKSERLQRKKSKFSGKRKDTPGRLTERISWGDERTLKQKRGKRS